MSDDVDGRDGIAARYARRDVGDRYSPLRPDVWQTLQQRQRALIRLLSAAGHLDLSGLRLFEVGCGAGDNLLELIRLGFAPAHVGGIELLEPRWRLARERLPAAATLLLGDALDAPLADASQDVVLQSTVFSSLLADATQQRLAAAMWRWTRPGGAVLWYDLRVGNPRNRDVRGVPLARIRELFPQGTIRAFSVTLAPPLARAACALHPSLYTLLNALPPLRTHLLCWIGKPHATHEATTHRP